MRRLTWKNEIGDWGLYDIPWENLRPGAVIDDLTWQRLYGALRKLMAYEYTGLEPKEIARFKFKDAMSDVATALAEVKDALEYDSGTCWIPVGARMPEPHRQEEKTDG